MGILLLVNLVEQDHEILVITTVLRSRLFEAEPEDSCWVLAEVSRGTAKVAEGTQERERTSPAGAARAADDSRDSDGTLTDEEWLLLYEVVDGERRLTGWNTNFSHPIGNS